MKDRLTPIESLKLDLLNLFFNRYPGKLSLQAILLRSLMPYAFTFAFVLLVALAGYPQHYQDWNIYTSIAEHGGIVATGTIIQVSRPSHGVYRINYHFPIPTTQDDQQILMKSKDRVQEQTFGVPVMGQTVQIIYSRVDPQLSKVQSEFKQPPSFGELLETYKWMLSFYGCCSTPLSLIIFLWLWLGNR